MVDQEGQAYIKLPQAFRFRETYVADCTCQGNPWDAKAIARHESYEKGSPAESVRPLATDKEKSAEPRRRNRESHWGYRARRDSDD